MLTCGIPRPSGTKATGILDFIQPVAALLFGILHFIPGAEDPYEITRA